MNEHSKPIEIAILDNVYVDAGIARYIEEFNDLGYSTKMSCSGMELDGHDDQNRNKPYISFELPSDLTSYRLEYFKVLASCFMKLNELEVQKYPFNPENRIFWHLHFQPSKIKNPSDIIGMTSYLPDGLNDENIFEKLEELLHMLRTKDFFNKLSEKTIKNGEEIIIVL